MSVTSVFAQSESTSGNNGVASAPTLPPAPSAGDTLPTATFPTFVSVNPSLPPLDTGFQPPQDSAFIRTSPIVQKLLKKQYRSDEDISFAIANPQNDSFRVDLFDAKGQKAAVAVSQTNTDTGTTYDVAPRIQFRPGKYTLLVTDAYGKSSKQDFSWGVLAINSDRSVYLPGQTADLAMAVLDDNGNMVCDAKLDLNITTATASASNVISTGNGKITVNPQCQSHKFSLSPDYEAHYRVGSAGTYKMSLTAQTKSGSYTISDQLIVQDAVPFDVERVSATRIYPPNKYPVQFNITANQDFDGTVSETVPDSFTVTSSDTADSYTSMQTLYLNQNSNPAARLAGTMNTQVLGASTSALLLPFTGSYPITEGFGVQQTEPALRLFYEHYGLAGHDGADFGLPIGTPVRSVDDGTVLLAGPGDYGITIVIQHAWGKSYYGHLSRVSVNVGGHVTKGEQIGFSGNTGEATGPHLHFGMKPNTPDMQNGYYGKIDPLPYFNLPSSAQVAIGPDVTASPSAVLGASTVDPQPGQVAPPQSITDAVAQATASALTNHMAWQILNTPTTANYDKVKVITWNVSLKKGQTVSLGYTFKAPQVSPQFYLLGPLRFYLNNRGAKDFSSRQPFFAETRQWQIAADQVGDAWYSDGTKFGGYSWQYRKEIKIDHTKVIPSYPTATFMESGTDATQDLSFYSSTGGTETSDTTVSNTGPRSIKFNSTGTNTDAFVEKAGVLADAGRRISFYVYFTSMPSVGVDSGLVKAYTSGGSTYIATLALIQGISATTGKLGISYSSGATYGSTTLNTNTWYHISIAYTITSTTVNQFRVYLNGNPEVSYSNITLATTVSNTVDFGLLDPPGANKIWNFDDIYVDSGSDLTDPGTISVTNKRPNANGAANSFATQVGAGGSGYGTGHSPQVNEQPLSTTNGWSSGNNANLSENYAIENASTGDVNISSSSLIADEAWIYANRSQTCTTPQITNNGANTTITLSTTNAIYTNIAAITSYPSNAATVGIVSCTNTKSANLLEAGMLFAYTSTTPNQTYSNFPVLISLTSDNDLAANAATSSGILFTDSTGQTKLDHEIENYVNSTGELEAWVRVPSLSTSADTILYMYYGNASATDQSNQTGVWDSNYKGVWHMAETSGTTSPDSTTNAATATKQSSTKPNPLSSGKIDGAQSLSGSTTDYETVSSATENLTGDKTVEAWVNAVTFNTDAGGVDQRLVFKNIDGNNVYQLTTWQTGSNFVFSVKDSNIEYITSTNAGYSTSTWYHVVGTYAQSTHTATLYINGATSSGGNAAAWNPASAGSLYFGMRGDNAGPFNGYLDEIRLSAIARSAGWITTEFNNMATPSAFFTVGSTDDIPSGTTVETKAYAPTMDQLMRNGKWFCPQAAAGGYPGDTTCANNPGIQPYVF